jgi:hypothetical protein
MNDLKAQSGKIFRDTEQRITDPVAQWDRFLIGLVKKSGACIILVVETIFRQDYL